MRQLNGDNLDSISNEFEVAGRGGGMSITPQSEVVGFGTRRVPQGVRFPSLIRLVHTGGVAHVILPPLPPQVVVMEVIKHQQD